MVRSLHVVSVVIAALLFAAAGDAVGQADDICRESGSAPSRDLSPGGQRLARFVYGRVILKGLTSDAKRPQVTVIYSDSSQPGQRQIISESGNYCFKRAGNNAGIVIEMDGVEVL